MATHIGTASFITLSIIDLQKTYVLSNRQSFFCKPFSFN